ncbi:hypothetical protein U1Q18_047377 [Sarracenia purpurea var. burkii]
MSRRGIVTGICLKIGESSLSLRRNPSLIGTANSRWGEFYTQLDVRRWGSTNLVSRPVGKAEKTTTKENSLENIQKALLWKAHGLTNYYMMMKMDKNLRNKTRRNKMAWFSRKLRWLAEWMSLLKVLIKRIQNATVIRKKLLMVQSSKLP